MNDHEGVKYFIDVLANSTTVAVLMGVLPVATVLLSFVWAVFRVYELKTVQDFLARRRDRLKAKANADSITKLDNKGSN